MNKDYTKEITSCEHHKRILRVKAIRAAVSLLKKASSEAGKAEAKAVVVQINKLIKKLDAQRIAEMNF